MAKSYCAAFIGNMFLAWDRLKGIEDRVTHGFFDQAQDLSQELIGFVYQNTPSHYGDIINEAVSEGLKHSRTLDLSETAPWERGMAHLDAFIDEVYPALMGVIVDATVECEKTDKDVWQKEINW